MTYIESSGEDLASRVLRKIGLHPDEFSIGYFYRDSGRRVRSNMIFSRKAVGEKVTARLLATKRVTEFLAEVTKLLDPKHIEAGIELRLFSAQKERIHGGTETATLKRKLSEKELLKVQGYDGFVDVLEELELGDIPIIKAGKLYSRLEEILGKDVVAKCFSDYAKRQKKS